MKLCILAKSCLASHIVGITIEDFNANEKKDFSRRLNWKRSCDLNSSVLGKIQEVHNRNLLEIDGDKKCGTNVARSLP